MVEKQELKEFESGRESILLRWSGEFKNDLRRYRKAEMNNVGKCTETSECKAAWLGGMCRSLWQEKRVDLGKGMGNHS